MLFKVIFLLFLASSSSAAVVRLVNTDTETAATNRKLENLPICIRDSDCEQDRACSSLKCDDPCIDESCGNLASCIVENHKAVCRCLPTLDKEDRAKCWSSINASSSSAAVVGIVNTDTETAGTNRKLENLPICIRDSDCEQDRACSSFKCDDPCIDESCSNLASCIVENHKAVCRCLPTLDKEDRAKCWSSIDASSSSAAVVRLVNTDTDTAVTNRKLENLPICIRDSDCEQDRACSNFKCDDPCIDESCSNLASCIVENHKAVCRCLPTLDKEDRAKCWSSIDASSSSAAVVGLINTDTETAGANRKLENLPKCIRDSDCEQDRACSSFKCDDPCIDESCGNLASCNVENHKAVCRCLPTLDKEDRAKCWSSIDASSTTNSPTTTTPKDYDSKDDGVSGDSGDVTEKIPPTRRPPQEGSCMLPPYPDHGTYTTNKPNAKPGDRFKVVAVNVTCDSGYACDGSNFAFCSGGTWFMEVPECVAQCQLPYNPSVEYHCVVSLDYYDGFRACKDYEPTGTSISPVCRPHYYSASTLKYMRCNNGVWYNTPACIPECGTSGPDPTKLSIGGENAEVGEIPWHAGIYSKSADMQICGGSIISTNIVISAAHCFWDNTAGKQPASDFLVAVGKLYRSKDNKKDRAQWSEVESIRMPPRFRGSTTNYQDDIAVVQLSTPIEYRSNVRPVCVDFDHSFEERHLQPENMGKVAGWGLTGENGTPAEVLQVVELPYIPISTCYDNLEKNFAASITSDKICAGYINRNTALCMGDSGGGLTFLEVDKGVPRYYLRGIVSTAPTNDNLCNANVYTTFTKLSAHKNFISRFWRD